MENLTSMIFISLQIIILNKEYNEMNQVNLKMKIEISK